MAKKPITFNSPYGQQPPRCFFETTGESMTQPQFQEESEINNILRSHDRNGVIEHINKGKAIYGDFSNITDFSDAIEQINQAKEEFQNIPWEIREKFQNDAGQFFKFATNEDNKDELIKMGLLNPEPSVAMPTEQESSSVETPKISEEEDSARITT